MFVSFCQSSCPLFKSIWKSDVNAERRARDANDRILCSRVVHRLQVIQVHRAGLKMSQCAACPNPQFSQPRPQIKHRGVLMALRSEDGESGTNANKTLNGRAAAQNSVFLSLSLLWLFKYAQWARVSLDAFARSCETRFS